MIRRVTKIFLIPLFCMTIIGFEACEKRSEETLSPVKPIPIPATLEDAKSLHRPPNVNVIVTRKKESRLGGGSGACHAGPVCLMTGMALLYNQLFPKQYDYVTIEKNGTLTYAGTFTPKGNFIQARTFSGTNVKDYRRLNLKKLGRVVDIEVAHGEMMHSGEDPKMSLTAILPQVDLLADYKTKLDGLKRKPNARAELLIEAYTWLGKEGHGWINQRLTARDEMDQTKGKVMKFLCDAGMDVGPLAEKDISNVGPHTATAALFCTLGIEPIKIEQVMIFLPGTIRGICTGEIDEISDGRFVKSRFLRGTQTLQKLKEAIQKLPLEDKQKSISQIKSEMNRCEAGALKTAVLYAFGMPVTKEILADALLDKTTETWLLKNLNIQDPASRAAILLAMEKADDQQKKSLEKKLSTFDE